jgi:hypothetical protein
MKASVVIISTVLLATIVIFGIRGYRQTVSSKAKIKCWYMAYACGECWPQYRIKDVFSVSNVTKKELLNKDVRVIFKSEKLEKKIDSLTYKCVVCYDFYIEGELSYIPAKKYYEIKADTCVTKLRDKECCK